MRSSSISRTDLGGLTFTARQTDHRFIRKVRSTDVVWLHCVLVAFAAIATALELPDLLTLSVVVVLAGLLTLLRLESALYVTVFLVPWQLYLVNWPNTSYTFRYIDIVIAWTVIGTLFKFSSSGKFGRGQYVGALLVFMLLGSASGVVNGSLYGTGKFLIDWWPSLAFYWLLLVWGAKLDWRTLTKIFLVSYMFQAVLGLLQTIVGDPRIVFSVLQSPVSNLFFDPDLLSVYLRQESFNFIWHGRVFAFGTYLGASGLGMTLAISAVLSWAFAFKERRLSQSWYSYAGLLLSITCCIVLKRSGWVALFAGLLIIGVLGRRLGCYNRQRMVWVMVLPLVMAGIFALWSPALITDRVYDQVGWEFGRENTWPVYLEVISHQGLLGVGPGYSTDAQGLGLSTNTIYAVGPENTFLHLALVGGILGLLVLLWHSVSTLMRLWRAQRSQNPVLVIAIISALAAMAIGGMFVIAVGDLQTMGPALFLLAMSNRLS